MNPVFVGVDLVDRADPRTVDKAADERFVKRVFSESERARIRESVDPDGELWALWAAKEAGFKVFCKLAGEVGDELPVFRHAAFEVTDPIEAPIRQMEYEGARITLDTEIGERRTMVWAWNGGSPELIVARTTVAEAMETLSVSATPEDWQTDLLEPIELEAVHGLNSALVRVLAKQEAARMLGVDADRLTIVCPPGPTGLRPPYLHHSGTRLTGADVSLSHDGQELAWAIRSR